MTVSPLPDVTLPDDPDLRAVIVRAMEAAAHAAPPSPAAAREDAADWPRGAAPPPAHVAALGVPRLASDRACIETNMARKGIWCPHGGRGAAILDLLDTHDHLGTVQRIDAGRPLGSLALDVLVWVCSRWREMGDRDLRHVPLTLAGLAMDLGWRKGGGAAIELARAIDALTQATFRARVYNARLGEMRVDTFGLVDRWERGEGDRPGRRAQTGFLVLGDWLHEQLRRGHLTYVSWAELRALCSGTARRLLLFLDAERFHAVLRHPVDAQLFATLGIAAQRECHMRATLRRAAREVASAPNRYALVDIERGKARGEYVLVAERAAPARDRGTGAVRAIAPGQSAR